MAEKPSQLQENPIVPPGTTPLIFDKFTTLNTKASRNGIKDEEMFWCDGFMPLGPNNLRTLPDIGAPIYTATGGKTVVWYNFGNLSFTPYCVVLLSDGSIIAVNTNTFAVSAILAAGSVTSPNIFNIGMSQWGQQYIIIVVGQTNGFYIWDGTNTFQTGSLGPDVTLVNDGLDYTSPPTVGFYGGAGSGATATAQVSDGFVTNVAVTNPGAGYTPADGVILTFTGGGSSGVTALATSSISGGSVTAATIISPGSGYTTSASVSFIGGYGIGATGTLSIVSGTLYGLSLTAGGANYATPPTITFSGGGSGASASADILGPVGSVTLTAGGTGYTAPPGVTFTGGGGTGAAATAGVTTGSVTSLVLTAPGSGYTTSPTISFGGPGTGATAIAHLAAPVVFIGLTAAGTGYTSPTTVIFSGGGGSGATATVDVSSGGVGSISITTGGSGYTSAPTPFIVDPNATVAQGYVDLMPSGVEGTSVETYSSRLFISESALIQISAPGSLVDFSTANGGDEFTSTDSFLRASFVKLQQSNGFIYLVADSSVNYISNIQTGGSPLLTQFSNQNADPEVGSPWSTTSGVFGENIILANPSGVYVGYGGRFIKISDALDGIFSTVPGIPSIISAAKAIIFGRKVWMLLGQILNPITNTAQNKLMMTDGKAWWTSSQSVTLTFVASQEINSVLTAFGTDGTSIYPLFQTPSTNFVKTVQSRFWDEPGGYLTGKTADRLWGAVNYYNITSPALTISVDTENGSRSYTVNTSIAATGVSVLPVFAVAQEGTLMGMTLSTSCADVALISLQLGVQAYSYRG